MQGVSRIQLQSERLSQRADMSGRRITATGSQFGGSRGDRPQPGQAQDVSARGQQQRVRRTHLEQIQIPVGRQQLDVAS